MIFWSEENGSTYSIDERFMTLLTEEKGSNHSIDGGFCKIGKSHVTKSWTKVLFTYMSHDILCCTKLGVFMETASLLLENKGMAAYILPSKTLF